MKCFFIVYFLLVGGGGIQNAFAQELRTGTYPDGKLRYKGYFKEGKPVGEVIRYYPEGKIKAKMNYRGDTVEAVLYGKNNDYQSVGKYIGKKKWGTWEYRKGKRIVAKEDYNNNQLHGKSFRYGSNGNLMEEKNWLHGKADGRWCLFYETGLPRLEAAYTQGKLEGRVRSYDQEGKLRVEGSYKDNLKEGIWIYYMPSGDIAKKQVYHAGVSERAEEEEIEASRQLDALLLSDKKIPDPAVFSDDPEAYMRLTGMEE